MKLQKNMGSTIDKTKIVYCKDANSRDDHDHTSLHFLGYTFRPRRSCNKLGKIFVSFAPAISQKAQKKIKGVIRDWKFSTHTGMTLEKIAYWINPQIRGWIQYYGKFNWSALYHLTDIIETKLSLWASKKYKRLGRLREQGRKWFRRIRKRKSGPHFAHWEFCP